MLLLAAEFGAVYWLAKRPFTADLCAGAYGPSCYTENNRFIELVETRPEMDMTVDLRLSVGPSILPDGCALELELDPDSFELPVDPDCNQRVFIAFPNGFVETLPYDAYGDGRVYRIKGRFIALYREQYGMGPLSYPKYLLEPE